MNYQLVGPEEARITIQRVDHDTAPPREAWLIEYDPTGGAPDPKTAIEQVLSDTRSDEGWYPEHYVERRQTVYEWGASGSVEIVVLGITAAFAYDVLRTSVLALIDRIQRSNHRTFPEQPITSGEAVERARWRVGSVYAVEREELEVCEVSETDGTWLVVFRTGDIEHRATVGMDSGYPSFSELAMRKLK